MLLNILIVTTPTGYFDIIVSKKSIYKTYNENYNYEVFVCYKNIIKEDIKNNFDIFGKYIKNVNIVKDIFYCNEIKGYIKQEIIKQIHKIENEIYMISPPVSPSNRSNIPLQSIPEENRKYPPRNCMEWVFDLALLGYKFDYKTNELVEKID